MLLATWAYHALFFRILLNFTNLTKTYMIKKVHKYMAEARDGRGGGEVNISRRSTGVVYHFDCYIYSNRVPSDRGTAPTRRIVHKMHSFLFSEKRI